MKLYYDSDADGVPDTEVTAIFKYPTITNILDKPSLCVVELVDFEGGLYATWEPLDFTKMSIKDDSANQIFIGYLISKKYTAKSLVLTIAGFGIKMTWTPFNNNYGLEQGGLRTIVDGELITCYDDLDLDGDYAGVGEDYAWGVNQWSSNVQDKGILVEQPVGLNFETWKCSALDDAGYFNSYENGDHTDTQSYLDGIAEEYSGYRTTTTITGSAIEFTIDSTWDAGEDVIPDTKYFKRIKIDYRYSIAITNQLTENVVAVYLQIYNYTTTSWERVIRFAQDWEDDEWHKTIDSVGGKDHITAPLNSFILEESATITIADYLDDDGGGNYDTIKLRLYVGTSNIETPNVLVWVDYLAARIYYHSDDVGAIMLPIASNAASTITCYGADWDNLGVDEDDVFKIGENSRQIIGDIIAVAGLSEKRIDGFGNSGTISARYPTGDTATIDWLTTGGNHFGELDDANDATYVDTIDHEDDDIYTFDNISLRGGYVSAIKIYCRQKGIVDKAILQITYSTDGGSNWSSIKFDDITANWVTEDSTWSGLELYDMSDFQVKLHFDELLAGGRAYVSELYVDFTLTLPSFDKYSARDFKGSFCIGALRKMKALEGFHWTEDHETEKIIIVKPTDFVDNTVNLTEADYGFDWEFEDKCNSIKAVHVYGNATLAVKATSSAGDANSPIERQIIDEGIASYANALKVAESEVGLYATKTPNIKLSLVGTNPLLKVGTDVHITFARPTIAIALYPIRIIERSKFGGDIKTIIWCGLGQTEADEKIANAIINASFLAHDAHQARLIATAPSAGATITWGDVGGAQAAVEAIITTEVGAGESIDNAIDALIAAIPAGQTTAATLINENIGVANKRWIHCPFFGESTIPPQWEKSTVIRNTTGRNDYLGYNSPVPMFKIINGTTYWLYVTGFKVGVFDADANDYIDQFSVYGMQVDGGGATLEVNDINPGVGATNITAAGVYDIDLGGTFDCNNGGDPYTRIHITMYMRTNANRELDVDFIRMEYYYDTV